MTLRPGLLWVTGVGASQGEAGGSEQREPARLRAMRVDGEAEPRNAGASPGASSTTRPDDTSM